MTVVQNKNSTRYLHED